MAVPPNTWETYDGLTAGNIREDLADIIYNIAPTETPGMSNIGRGSTKGTFHEWQIDSLDTAVDNKAIEGDDASTDEITPSVRVGNYTQIADKVIRISGSDMSADNAGKATEMAYQLSKRGMELKRDMEVTLFGTNKGRAAGSSGTERELGPIMSWISTNTSIGTGSAADPTGDGTDPRVDGTTRIFTEALLTDVIDQIFNAGGNPSMILTGAKQKRLLTGFTGGASKFKDAAEKTVVNAVDLYVSDYGELSVVPDRFMRDTEVFIMDNDMWSVDFYRDFQTHDLAKTGDSERKQMLVEYTLTSKQEASSGGIFDLS